MASFVVYVCQSNGASVAEVMPGRERPTCETGQGKFVAITETEAFDVTSLSIEEVTMAWTAGFTVMAIGLVVVQAGRALLRALK